MSRQRTLPVLMLLIAALALTPGAPLSAQDGGACPALVQAALTAVDASCAGLGRDEACYGHTRVTAAFRQPRDPADFDAPADRVPLPDVQSLATVPLDPASGEWGVAVLRLRADLPETMPGQAVTFLLMGSAQVENAVAPGDPASGPMQAFYLTTGLSASTCAEAPDALVVRSPSGAAVTLRVNDLDLQIGSTVILFLAQVDGQTVMVAVLLDGHLQASVNGTPVDLTASAGQPAAFAVTLNPAGRVDASSLVVSVPGTAGATVQAANAALDRIGFFSATCTVTASSTVNLRAGPGTDTPVQGQLTAGQSEAVTGKAYGADGSEWWQLSGGAWVRADLVSASGDCETLTEVSSLPQGCETRPHYYLGTCQRHVPCMPIVMDEPIQAGESVHFSYRASVPVDEGGTWPTGSITVNGQEISSRTEFDDNGFALKADWIATPGTVTVVATLSTGDTNTCTLAIEPAPPVSGGVADPSFVMPITFCAVSAGGVSPWRLPANIPMAAESARPASDNAEQAANSAAYFALHLIVDGVSLGEGSRRVSTECTQPLCVRTTWTMPPLAPGQHTLQAVYSYSQPWQWEVGGNFIQPGTVDSSDVCTITVE